MHARVASGVFLALGFADLAVLNLLLAPRLAAQSARAAMEQVAPCEMPRTPAAARAPAPAAPRAAEAPARAKPIARALPSSAAPDVLFALESTRVTSREASLALQRVARELGAGDARSVLLRGHADRLGNPAHNLALSRQRAAAVRLFLIARGAPAERILVEALGDTEPADRSDTPTAWAKNRRVQILWR